MLAPSKSQVDFYVDLAVQLVRSDPPGIVRFKHIERDVATIRSRVASEGLSFLTKTLPKLGKALDLGLTSQRLEVPREFKRSHKNRSIPAFMQAYFNLLFDSDGVLRADASAGAVKHLRQVLFAFYKLEVPYSAEAEDAVISAFVKAEDELELREDVYSTRLLDAAANLIADILEDFDPKDIRPRHGPGAVATGERLDDKWAFSRLYSSIHSVFPYYEYFVVGGGRELLDRKAWYKNLERLDHGCAKVVLVPKDSRGPRLISCEPLEFQWIQQGVGRKLMAHLERHVATRGHINFTNQEINRRLALESSRSQEYATLDLKEASDRVSLALVRRVFSKVPAVLRALEACRTTETLLPSGVRLALKKFAPMGSALCFPVEALVFWSLLVSANSIRWRLPQRVVGKRVFVYGDDLIVPVDWAPQSMVALEKVGLKVNTTKCCITGKFRESCGMDAFDGEPVTPTRIRKLWTNRPSDATAYSAYISYANDLRDKGYLLAASAIWVQLHYTYGFIPYGVVNSGYPCYTIRDPELAIDWNMSKAQVRWNRHYQRVEFRLKYVKATHKKTSLDGWCRLLRDNVMGPGDCPSEVVVPRSTKLKRGWMPV